MHPERLYFLDWLRMLAILILVFFHTGLIFAAETNFHIKNGELSTAMEVFIIFIHGWRLTLLFFISGIGTSIALNYRGKSEYIKERSRRLLIPLLFGILVIVPPQIYFERLQQGFTYNSFGSFYLESFSTGLYPYGNISWHHLWFVAYLFVYSIASLPIFTVISDRPITWVQKLTEKTGNISWAFPLASIATLLKPFSPGIQNIVSDLSMFCFYWLVFLAGFMVHRKSFWKLFDNKLVILLPLAIFFTLSIYLLKWFHFPPGKDNSLYLVYYFIKICNAWIWLLTVLALGKKYLSAHRKYLSVLNEAVYPVYILHQTIIIFLGYYVVQLPWPLWIKFLVISLATIVICLFLYFLIRTNKITRICFGMKV